MGTLRSGSWPFERHGDLFCKKCVWGSAAGLFSVGPSCSSLAFFVLQGFDVRCFAQPFNLSRPCYFKNFRSAKRRSTSKAELLPQSAGSGPFKAMLPQRFGRSAVEAGSQCVFIFFWRSKLLRNSQSLLKDIKGFKQLGEHVWFYLHQSKSANTPPATCLDVTLFIMYLAVFFIRQGF